MTREEFGRLLNLEEDYIPEGRTNRPQTPNSQQFITIHNTDNDGQGADAHAHAKLVRNTGYRIYKGKIIWISWHYTVDDSRIVQHLPLKEGCYHTLNGKNEKHGGNQKSIAIEICMNRGIDQQAAFLRAARLVAALLYDLRKSAEVIVPHYYWTGKICPSLLLDHEKPGAKWNNFISMVKAELATIA